MSAALWAAVKLRYNSDKLEQLTNVNNPGATAVDDTVGTQAATDARSWFKRVAQKTFDDTDADDLEIGVWATYVKLREWSGKYSQVIQDEKQAVEDAMTGRRSQGAGKRITPKTSAEITPTDEVPGGQTVRPHFDNDRFDRLIPDPPPAP